MLQLFSFLRVLTTYAYGSMIVFVLPVFHFPDSGGEDWHPAVVCRLFGNGVPFILVDE
jgi:hypothetical protein